MNTRHVVALSLIWTGILVALSRGWLGDVRRYVESVTGKMPTAVSSFQTDGGGGGAAGGAR